MDTVTVHQVGDKVYTMSADGKLSEWYVQKNGTLTPYLGIEAHNGPYYSLYAGMPERRVAANLTESELELVQMRFELEFRGSDYAGVRSVKQTRKYQNDEL